MDCWSEKLLVGKVAFQYPMAPLSLSLANPDSSLRQQHKQTYPLQPSYKRFPIILIRYSARSCKMNLQLHGSFRMLTPQHTYCDKLKVVAKTVTKRTHQNQAINIGIVKDKDIKESTRLTYGEVNCTILLILNNLE